MKCTLISTLFNEANNLGRWWECLSKQTVRPDEIIIVDGGSTDGTWEQLQALAAGSAVPVKLKQERLNIAAGRNRAIEMTDADIVATIDGGSFADADWFEQLTGPLLKDPNLDVVGGRSSLVFENEFQRFLQQFEQTPVEPKGSDDVYPSSRNAAFRRKAWADVGGYPEWLTLTGEDALFNFELHKIGKLFRYNGNAIVHWPVRPTEKAYLKMLFSYGYGAAEAQLYDRCFWQNLAVTFFPPLLLLSRHRFRHLKFRYLKNYSAARGWLFGKLKGRRPPHGWKRLDGIWLSPEAERRLNN